MFGLTFISSWDTPFDPATHAVDDAFFCLSATITEELSGSKIEPGFRVEIENPGVVGIMTGSSRYAFLWERRAEDAAPVLLARGRMVPLPTGMSGVRIELTFRCIPPSSDDVLKAAANARRIGEIDYDPDASASVRDPAEAYDPLFFNADSTDDPEGALAGTLEVWRWNPQTLGLSTTHLIESDVLHTVDYEGLGEPPTLTIGVPPKPVTKLRLAASWTQHAKGEQTIPPLDYIITYTADDFIQAFPRPGTAIGSSSGWTLARSEIVSVSDEAADWVNISGAKFGLASGGMIQIRPKRVQFLLSAAYDYSQQREELLTISMPVALQEIPDDDDEEESHQTLQMSALNIDGSTAEWEYEDPDTLEQRHYNVGDEVLANGRAWTCLVAHDATDDFTVRSGDVVLWLRRERRAPMRDSRSPRFFDTDRGVRAVRHGIRRLQRIVVERSQCAETSFEVEWSMARSMTCADSARIRHRRLPGGEQIGKITKVELVIEEGGSRRGRITIASTIGTGAAAAIPEAGQQQTADITYSTSYRGVNEPVDAYGLAAQHARVYAFENTRSSQFAAANGSSDPIAAIGALPTRLTFAMQPIREEDLLRRRMTVVCEPIVLPKQLNLRPDLGA